MCVDSMSAMFQQGSGMGSEKPVVKPVFNAFPQIRHSGNANKAHHYKTLRRRLSKTCALRKYKTLSLTVPFPVAKIGFVNNDPNDRHFDVIGENGNYISISSNSAQVLRNAKKSLIKSILMTRVRAFKTPRQMVEELAL